MGSSSDEEPDQNDKSSAQKEGKFVPISEIEFKFLLQDSETVTEGI